MVSLLLSLALAQPGLARFEPRRNTDGNPLFEFAPASGGGMGTACACTTPTGAKGEALTFTRASSGTCLKGNTTSGIADSDMVTCTNNQPRVMPGGDGTGGNGLLVEGARTNSTLRSEALDNAAWTAAGSSAPFTPTVTANAAVAPDGTTTAERIQFAATASGEYSLVLQAGACSGSASWQSVFLKGVSGSGTVKLCADVGAISESQCTNKSFVSTSWTRVDRDASTNTRYLIGTVTDVAGTPMSAADVYVWGTQCETGTFATSYVATAGATVTRALDVGAFTLSGSITNTSGSWAGTMYSPTTAGAVFMALGAGTAGSALVLVDNTRAATYDTTNLVQVTGLSSTANRSVRVAGSWSGSTLATFADGSSNTGSYDGTMISSTTMYVGTYSTGASATFGVIKQVCVDPAAGRCR